MMSDNGKHNPDLQKLLDNLKEYQAGLGIDDLPPDSSFAEALQGIDWAEIRQSARQKVLQKRHIKPPASEVSKDWLLDQLEESKVDVAVWLLNEGGRAIRANIRAAFKAFGLAAKIVWRALTDRHVRGGRG